MRRSPVLLVLILLAGFTGAGAFLYRHLQRVRVWRELTSLEGQPLARDTEVARRAAHLLDLHLGSDTKFQTWPGSAPFFVVSADGLILVFQCFTATSVNPEPAPGGMVLVFDRSGRLIQSEPFSFGWSLFPGVPSVFWHPEFQRNLIVIPCKGQSGLAREFFVLRGAQLDLLRLEDAGGKAISNRYDGHSVGAWMDESRIRQMETDLNSDYPCDQLSALVWLGGKHLSSEQLAITRHPDQQVQIATVEKLRRGEKVRARVEALTKSSHRWVAEAARLALPGVQGEQR